MTTKFFDTNALLKLEEHLLEEQKFLISSISLQELEHIKSSRNKDEQIKYKARKITNILKDRQELYIVVPYDSNAMAVVLNLGLEETPDNKICACAAICGSQDIVFVSDDICCGLIAKNIFGLNVQFLNENNEEKYTGFKEVAMSDEDMAYFYENLNENIYGLTVNEYLILKNDEGVIVDKYKWTGTEHATAKVGTIKSEYFGSVKPYNGDVYQQCALNSMVTNQVTMIKGPAGTGKSYLALGYLFYLLDKRKIDKIIVFCNTVATANSAKLGYYPGTKDEKLQDSAIGNMLNAKLGGDYAVERLIQDGKLLLLPMSDIRGYDTSNMNAAVYITEAQNMDISLMKLALQRIGEDCICIIDGDYNTQVDLGQYAGSNNGMRRMSKVFRGQEFYGEIELQNIYRSKIAMIAENM